MKKTFLILVLILLVVGLAFVGFNYLFPSFFQAPEPDKVEIIGSEDVDVTVEPEDETDTIVIEEENTSEDEDVVVDGTNSTTQTSTSSNTARKVPILSEKKLFQNTFVRFSYPSSVTVEAKTMNSLEIWKDNERIGTIAIYNNDEDLTLEAFLQKDNLVDYFAEADQLNITPKSIQIATAIRAVLFKDFPGFVTSDIVLVEFEKLILVVSDWSSNDILVEYMVPSLEKIN